MRRCSNEYKCMRYEEVLNKCKKKEGWLYGLVGFITHLKHLSESILALFEWTKHFRCTSYTPQTMHIGIIPASIEILESIL